MAVVIDRQPVSVVETWPDVDVNPSPPESEATSRVLIVDDDPNTVRALSARIRQWGYGVRAEHNGRSGVTAALHLRPDFMLVDIGMAGGDGYYLADTIRRSVDYYHPIPMAFITCQRRFMVLDRCQSLGAVDVVEKPFDMDVIRDLLSRYIY